MEVKIMAKLVLPKSAYKGIPGVKKCKKQTSPEYEERQKKQQKESGKNNCSRRRLQKMQKITFANNIACLAKNFHSSLIFAY